MKALDEQQVVLDYQNNMPIDDIMARYDAPECEIRAILKKNEIDRGYNSFVPELIERIIFLYQKGWTYKKIEAALLVSESGIRKTLKRNGVQRRSSSECNRRYCRNQHYFDSIDTPNKAYVLGLLFADGCNHRAHYAITLSLQEGDRALVEAVKAELEYEGPLRTRRLHEQNPNYQNQTVLCINDEYMSQRLEELGMVNAKSLIVEFPDYLPQELIRHFVRGYFDGNGCISWGIYNGKVRAKIIFVSSTKFCQRLQAVIYDMGVHCAITHKDYYKPETSTVESSGPVQVWRFMNWLYYDADLYLERKYQKYVQLCSVINRPCEIPNRINESVG